MRSIFATLAGIRPIGTVFVKIKQIMFFITKENVVSDRIKYVECEPLLELLRGLSDLLCCKCFKLRAPVDDRLPVDTLELCRC